MARSPGGPARVALPYVPVRRVPGSARRSRLHPRRTVCRIRRASPSCPARFASRWRGAASWDASVAPVTSLAPRSCPSSHHTGVRQMSALCRSSGATAIRGRSPRRRGRAGQGDPGAWGGGAVSTGARGEGGAGRYTGPGHVRPLPDRRRGRTWSARLPGGGSPGFSLPRVGAGIPMDLRWVSANRAPRAVLPTESAESAAGKVARCVPPDGQPRACGVAHQRSTETLGRLVPWCVVDAGSTPGWHAACHPGHTPDRATPHA